MKPIESSFLIFQRSSLIFGCSCFADLHDFFVNYIKNTLKLLCFRKNRITYSNIKILQMSQNHWQLLKYCSVLLVKPIENDWKHAKNNVRWLVINLQASLKLDNLKVFESQFFIQFFNLICYCHALIPLNLDKLRNNPHNFLWRWKVHPMI